MTRKIVQPILPREIDLKEPYWYVVSEKNLDEFLARLEKEEGQVVFLAMSVPDYELMAYNMQEIKRYILEMKEVIMYAGSSALGILVPYGIGKGYKITKGALTKQLNKVFIEQFSVLDKYKIAGTPDRVIEYKGERFIADIKTGRIDHPNNIAIQLAIYANGSPYDVATGRRGSWGDINKDKAIIIHLPAGTGLCKLVWIDIAEGWKGVQFAMKVRQWRDKKGLATPFEEGDISG